MDRSSLVLLPEREVRGLLRESDMSLRMLRPPYPALGIGVLRVLRVRTEGAAIELVAGYERYERLAANPGGP